MAAITSKEDEESIPFYPDHVKTEAKVVVGLVVLALIIATIGMLAPVGVGDPADPMDTPLHVKPEWYFLALYQLLKYIPKTAGVVIPMIGVFLVLLWPFIDRKPDKSPRTQKIRAILAFAGVVLFIAGTIWGEVS
jgi:quinol-cytochrome oxidoreductase complex cytochrome b subunit